MKAPNNKHEIINKLEARNNKQALYDEKHETTSTKLQAQNNKQAQNYKLVIGYVSNFDIYDLFRISNLIYGAYKQRLSLC